MRKPNLPTASFLLAATIGLTSCGKQAERATPERLPAVGVRVQTVESKSRLATEEVVGTVRARLRSVLEAKVSGKIDRMLVVPGQNVKTGEVLATIEAREVQARLDQALAVRQQAEADLKRFAALLEQKILAQAEFDAAESKFRVADGAVREAETLLSYTQVTAPFDGVITRKHADVGDLATPGRPLLEMEDARTLRLEADVPEAVIGRVALGDKLPVRIAALETEVEGIVSEISPAADPGSRTFLVKLDLPAQPGVRAGQFGRVAMPVGETSALRVPVSAVIQRGQMELVFVVRENQAQLRLVKTGKRIGTDVELVSGLEAGERIVVEGTAGLIDGQPVTIP
ncbi:MAG: efflux RND transporter periplasmic adaptor subunit [Verrucomicrobia bacterium]|nr:efflux RND transporter periplasmic adaptor subunit [Verrucomicrobiota bacterium]